MDEPTRPRVFVTQPIAASALDRLRPFADLTVNPDSSRILPREALLAAVLDCDFLLSLMHDKIDGAIIAANRNLRGIASMAVTPSDIDVDEATRRGVAVTTAPAIVTEATADICFGLLIAVARRIVEGDRLVRQGVFPGGQSNHLLGSGVFGKTLGLIGGGGRIGAAVARRARGFQMDVLYWSPRRKPHSVEQELGLTFVPFDELLQEVGFRFDPFAAQSRDAAPDWRARAQADEADGVSHQHCARTRGRRTGAGCGARAR